MALCEFFDGSAAHLGKMGSTQRKVNHSVNFSTGPPLAKASDFQQSQDDCLTTISRVAFSDPGFCDFPGAPALKKSLAICLVQKVDFHEIPMENEPRFSIFRRVRRWPWPVVFSKARMIVCREIAISDFGSGIFRLSGRPGSEEIVSDLLS